MGVRGSSIFEYLNLDADAVSCLNLLCELHFCMAKVIAMDEASHKTYNQCRGCGALRRSSELRLCRRQIGTKKNRSTCEELDDLEEYHRGHL